MRCVLDVRGMVLTDVASIDVEIVDGGVMAPTAPGLGVEVDVAALGDPVAVYG